MSAQPIDREIARQAARWYVRLLGPRVSEAQRRDCELWRAADPEHERAWQLAEGFNQRLGLIPPQLGAQTLERSQAASRRQAMKLLALLLAAAPAALLVRRSQPWQQLSADVRSGVGEQRELTLADGTQLWLNTDSAIDIAYDSTARRVRLVAGELQIATARDDAGRPFILETAEGEVRPIGTRFLVRQGAVDSQVGVVEGAVRLQPRGGDAVLIRAGEQARFDTRRVGEPRTLDAHLADWTRGVLKAERMSLARFAAELGRYRPGLLRCDPAVAGLEVSGAFQLRDTDQALQALTQVLPVSIRYRTRYWVTIAPLSS
ncbi:transmembrane sensor [Pseudomonas nitritireducens]|uniref:Transmembrane sensor n=1 Tax=Pseudomonas nitroreducens TaxID=46680 RepID=A0A7W7KKG6_PSENT|nr:FecR domain-containing protein [Pseudomonas nitritireducens]MBB4864136.1 transmembrane sensor [Pseudomonas nitritireducens]